MSYFDLFIDFSYPGVSDLPLTPAPGLKGRHAMGLLSPVHGNRTPSPSVLTRKPTLPATSRVAAERTLVSGQVQYRLITTDLLAQDPQEPQLPSHLFSGGLEPAPQRRVPELSLGLTLRVMPGGRVQARRRRKRGEKALPPLIQTKQQTKENKGSKTKENSGTNQERQGAGQNTGQTAVLETVMVSAFQGERRINKQNRRGHAAWVGRGVSVPRSSPHAQRKTKGQRTGMG